MLLSTCGRMQSDDQLENLPRKVEAPTEVKGEQTLFDNNQL